MTAALINHDPSLKCVEDQTGLNGNLVDVGGIAQTAFRLIGVCDLPSRRFRPIARTPLRPPPFGGNLAIIYPVFPSP